MMYIIWINQENLKLLRLSNEKEKEREKYEKRERKGGEKYFRKISIFNKKQGTTRILDGT